MDMGMFVVEHMVRCAPCAMCAVCCVRRVPCAHKNMAKFLCVLVHMCERYLMHASQPRHAMLRLGECSSQHSITQMCASRFLIKCAC